MAIAYDTGSGTTGGSSTSTTLACTMSASANGVIFGGLFLVLIDQTPTATYNGVSMTLLNQINVNPVATSIYLFYLLNPATGTNNMVANYSTASGPSLQSASFTGVKQSGMPDASTTNSTISGTSLTTSLTTIGDNAWAVLFCRNETGPHSTAGTNSTIGNDTGNGTFFYSTTPKTPPGSMSMTTNNSLSGAIGHLMASFIPAPPAPTNFLMMFQ